ncbi:hypothetical protein T492DRAFT_470353 [Pavlovales sp. CCMP2436]|nr:hypothetical protein T492DRAFT_470353 [Pavlovales sp. CCMP2436]
MTRGRDSPRDSRDDLHRQPTVPDRAEGTQPRGPSPSAIGPRPWARSARTLRTRQPRQPSNSASVAPSPQIATPVLGPPWAPVLGTRPTPVLATDANPIHPSSATSTGPPQRVTHGHASAAPAHITLIQTPMGSQPDPHTAY